MCIKMNPTVLQQQRNRRPQIMIAACSQLSVHAMIAEHSIMQRAVLLPKGVFYIFFTYLICL